MDYFVEGICGKSLVLNVWTKFNSADRDTTQKDTPLWRLALGTYNFSVKFLRGSAYLPGAGLTVSVRSVP